MLKNKPKLKIYFFVALNIILGLIGVVAIQWGLIKGDELSKPLAESIGIGFIAAGLINIFDRLLTLEPVPEQFQRIEVVAEKRISTPQRIYSRRFPQSWTAHSHR